MSVPTGVCLEICWDWLIVSRHQPRCVSCVSPRGAPDTSLRPPEERLLRTRPHLARDGRGESLTTSLISTRTYQIFKLKSIFFFYYIRHAHFHSYSDAKYCPVEPNLGKCEATWLRFALLIQFSKNSKFNTWFWLCWSVILYSIYPAHLIPWCFHERGSVI